jgi:RND family efflux transporter MFP subunit
LVRWVGGPVKRPVAVIVGLVAVVAIVATTAIWRATHSTSTDDAGAHISDIPTVAARYGTIARTITMSGRAGPSAAGGAKLAFGVSGTLEVVNVAIGDRVRRGEELARIDLRPYQLAAQQSQAQAQAQSAAAAASGVDRTSARIRADEADLSRRQTLYAAGVAARKDVQAAEAALAADRSDARVARDQSAQAGAQAAGAALQVRSSQYDLERTSLRAPFDGTVSEVDGVGGETVDASTPVLAVVPDGSATGTLDVSFAQSGELRTGDALSLRAGDTRWKSRVAALGPTIRNDTGVATVRVSYVPSAVVSGTPIDGTATVGTLRGIIVPIAAIIEDPESGANLVFVQSASSGKFTVRHVRIDGRDDHWARVVSGLHPGERVASQGAIDLLQQ